MNVKMEKKRIKNHLVLCWLLVKNKKSLQMNKTMEKEWITLFLALCWLFVKKKCLILITLTMSQPKSGLNLWNHSIMVVFHQLIMRLC